MERLTEYWEGHNIYLADIYDEEEDTGGIGSIPLDSAKVEKIVQRLGEYEQAEEDGLLIKIPCKEGTKVYEIVEVCNAFECNNNNKSCKNCYCYDVHITPMILSLSQIVLKMNEFGKTIFFTEEEAKEKLKEFLPKKQIKRILDKEQNE